jgi:hypothetical protein
MTTRCRRWLHRPVRFIPRDHPIVAPKASDTVRCKRIQERLRPVLVGNAKDITRRAEIEARFRAVFFPNSLVVIRPA